MTVASCYSNQLWLDYLMGYGLCILFHEMANLCICTTPTTTTSTTTTSITITPAVTAETRSFGSCKAAGVVLS